MRFYSLDVETANSDYSSICQIGIGVFEDGELVDTWKSYIDPEDYFKWRNISIHGITEENIQGQPIFPDVYPVLRKMFENNIVVHHSHFDRTAFQQVFEKYGLDPFEVQWLDSVRVARHAFAEGCLEGGYGLDNVAAYLDIEFQHHDALEDALACGKIVLEACKKLNFNVDQWNSLFKR
jgi:DNA polymerase-3 subunit epsilon